MQGVVPCYSLMIFVAAQEAWLAQHCAFSLVQYHCCCRSEPKANTQNEHHEEVEVLGQIYVTCNASEAQQ